MKYTPGPWTVGTIMDGLLTGTVVVQGKNGNTVNSFGTGSDPECAANAHLIAAAPEMYEALRNLENDNRIIPDHAWKMVKNAINKAEGKNDFQT